MRPAEVMTYVAWFAGWLLATGGLAALVCGRPALAVWLLSLGALGLGLGGLRLLGTLLWHGLAEAFAAADREEKAAAKAPRRLRLGGRV